MKFNKLRAAIAAGLLGLAALVAIPFSNASIQLGGSIFPLTFITQLPINLTDGFNQMLALINQQVMNGGAVISPPGGRLSMSSTVPVPTADVSSASIFYYIPYTGELAPIYNGTAGNPWQYVDFGSAGLSDTTTASYNPTSEAFDVYLSMQAGSPTLCTMYWGSNTSRSTSSAGALGTGNAAITQINGIWVNKAAIATGQCYNNATSYVIPANQGTLIGSIYTTGSATLAQTCKPAAASGGTALTMPVSNAYNRVPFACTNRDSQTSVTSSSATWANIASATDVVSWIDSLQQMPVKYLAMIVAGDATGGDCGYFGVSSSSAGTPEVFGATCAATSSLAWNYTTIATNDTFYPLLGWNTLYLEKASAAGTTTYMPVANEEAFELDGAY